MDMQEQIAGIRTECLQALDKVSSLNELEQLRVAVLGKKGSLTGLLRGMGQVDPALRPMVGQWINQAREELEGSLSAREEALRSDALRKRLLDEAIDVTQPGLLPRAGVRHPGSMVLDQVIEDEYLSFWFHDSGSKNNDFQLYDATLAVFGEPVPVPTPADPVVPADAVTASGSGLDPNISPAYADLQVARVARARRASPEQISKLVAQNRNGRVLGLFGEPTVNVLQLNLQLDHWYPLPG